MRRLAMIAAGVLLWQTATPAQTTNVATPPAEVGGAYVGATGVIGTTDAHEYTPTTASERFRHYVMSTYGPAALARAVASGAIAQAENTPKEWGGGAQAFGERVGNSYAVHVIRKSLEFGGAMALHEDNRYFHSTDAGFMRRTKHAIGSVFVTRDYAGNQHFAYSRFGGALGASFISRIWQPPSVDSPGDAAKNFGITIITDIGWNVVREFMPDIKGRFKRH